MTPARSLHWRQNPSYKWLVIGMLWLVCFFNYADRQAIFSVFPLLKQHLNLSNVQLGIVGGAFTWMYALFGPFAGSLCDRFSRKSLILGALIFWSLVTAATSICHNYAQLIACRALGGLGEAFYFPAAMSLISDYHGAATRSRAMSWHQSGVYAGTIAGGSISGIFGQYYGWQSSFVAFGIAGIVVAILLSMFLKEAPRGMSDEPARDSQASPAMMEGYREFRSRRLPHVDAHISLREIPHESLHGWRQRHRLPANRFRPRSNFRRHTCRHSRQENARRPFPRAVVRPSVRCALCFSHRVDHIRSHLGRCADRIRLFQGSL
jgi:MFS family permease